MRGLRISQVFLQVLLQQRAQHLDFLAGGLAIKRQPEGVLDTALGVLGLVDGIGDLVSSVVVGVLFTVASPAWGFGYGAVLAGAGAAVLVAPGDA